MSIIFNKLPVAKQRIRVAKDVIKQIDIKKYTVDTGRYVDDVEFKGYRDYSHLDIKDNFANIKKCQVCAIGACLLSITHFKNKLSFYDVGHNIYSLRNAKVKKLLSLFSKEQLLLIESAFEGLSYSADRVAVHVLEYDTDKCSEDLLIRASKYYSRFRSSKNRLKAIMNNIIKNKGTFIP